jgi:hypothetical protein
MRKVSIVAVLSLLVVALAAATAYAADSTSFKMVRSQAAVANECVKGATAHVDINTIGGLQNMHVTVNHAPKNKELELFITQQPNSPFGVSWYQGDFETNNNGHGEVNVRGIFGEELFVFAPGSVRAPQVDNKDAARNPTFKPVHTLHLGLWFGSPQEAKDAGCPGTVTEFDGDHRAGIQAFSTRNFPALKGPLSKISD